MRIALVTVEFPPTIFGGIGTFAYNLANALVRQGVEVKVIAGSPGKIPNRTCVEGIEILRLPREPLLPRHFWFQLRSLETIKAELASCDLIHGQDCVSFPLLNICKMSRIRIPWVVTYHTNPLSELLSIAHPGASLLDYVSYVPGFPLWDVTVRVLAKSADQSVAVSRSLREELRRTYRTPEDRMKVIHNCINLPELERISRGIERSVRRDKIKLFYAGRLYYRKGISRLLRILLSIKNDFGCDFQVQIFGSGPLENSLRHYVAKRELTGVIFRGHISYESLLEAMCQADIVCFPSLYEACPLLMIEAMGLGKPVVAFDLPFSREILGAETKELLAVNERDYALKLMSLIRSKDERDKLGEYLQKKAYSFDSMQVASQYKEVYESLLKQ